MFWTYIKKPIWNNKLSFIERQKLWSECKLYIPQIENEVSLNSKNEIKYFLDDKLKLWDKVVFEEVMNWKLFSKTWLETYLVFNYKNSKICIFDNHNIAFYFIWKYFLKTKKQLDLVHIDQHSDMYEPDFYPQKLENLEDIIKYTFEWINVWNYLLPLKKIWFIKKILQKRTEISVLETDNKILENSILNIDLDFWEENMATTNESLEKLKNYIWKSPLILIATSPYFIDQKKALELIYELLV